MTTRQYIGARYVPIFADPVEWDDEREYEPLMMVQHLGETYITKQYTPTGVQLPDSSQGEEDNEFWVHMSNWNAQVESYRQEVLQYNDRISTVENDLPTTDFDSTNTVKKYIDDNVQDIEDILPANDFTSTNTVKKYIDDNVQGVEDILPATGFDSTNTVKKYIDDNVQDIEDILPASSFTSTNTVKNQIDDKAKNLTNIVFIGDSWSVYGSGTMPLDWCQMVASSLGLNSFNFAEGSSGFCDNTASGGSTVKNFLDQINYAATQMSASEKAATKYIVVLGGLNDVASGYAAAAVYTNVMNIISSATTNFPNAEIHIFGINISNQISFSNQILFKQYLNQIALAVNNSTGRAVAHVNELWKLFVFDHGCYQNDNLHPTEYGCRKIGYLVKKSILGENGSMQVDATPWTITYHSRFGGGDAAICFATDTDTLYNSGIFWNTPNLTENLSAGSEYAIGSFSGMNMMSIDYTVPVPVYANVNSMNKFIGYTYMKGNNLMIKTIEPITSGTSIHPLWPIKIG